MKFNRSNLKSTNIDFNLLVGLVFRYWPFYLISILFFIGGGLFLIRYSDYKYRTSATIEIVDKSQDSEMALPTAMTIFNRSMINLDNEYGRLSSYRLNSIVVSKLKSNVKFLNNGTIKSNEIHSKVFENIYDLKFLIDTDTIKNSSKFNIVFLKNTLLIDQFDQFDELVNSYNFKDHSSINTPHELPFEITLRKNLKPMDDYSNITLKLSNFEQTVDALSSALDIKQSASKSNSYTGSDQIEISLDYSNPLIAEDYINTLIFEFDKDGVNDRKEEYKRTIDFVDKRSKFLNAELKKIEDVKTEFKKSNKLNDLKSDATYTITQQYSYDNELFEAISQKDLLKLLQDELIKSNFDLLPVNFGLKNESLNISITNYNLIISDRNKLLTSGAGPNNTLVKNLEIEAKNFYNNILKSIINYEKSLNIKIEKLNKKEKEFEKIYTSLPEQETILRSIERELEIKEALFLLLLQKKEEAEINYAVVKPTIKIIDFSRTGSFPVSPNKKIILIISLILAILIPGAITILIFLLDNKIRNISEIKKLTDIPVLAEIPNLSKTNISEGIKFFDTNSRHVFVEAMRILEANLSYLGIDKESSDNDKIILVTSSVKGEGKTIIASSIAKVLSNKGKKVLLIGSDLRNPQIHKLFKLKKDSYKGLSDLIFKKDLNWKDLIIKDNKLDILLSGTIPPNPSDLLSSKKYDQLMQLFKKDYDLIVIDSAPCLLVSDTMLISKYSYLTLYVTRSDYSDIDLIEYINQLNERNKLNNIGIVFNDVNNKNSYNYNYGYQYSYNYNYGYGYGYSNKDI